METQPDLSNGRRLQRKNIDQKWKRDKEREGEKKNKKSTQSNETNFLIWFDSNYLFLATLHYKLPVFRNEL